MRLFIAKLSVYANCVPGSQHFHCRIKTFLLFNAKIASSLGWGLFSSLAFKYSTAIWRARGRGGSHAAETVRPVGEGDSGSGCWGSTDPQSVLSDGSAQIDGALRDSCKAVP